jgi:hypothetical protein
MELPRRAVVVDVAREEGQAVESEISWSSSRSPSTSARTSALVRSSAGQVRRCRMCASRYLCGIAPAWCWIQTTLTTRAGKAAGAGPGFAPVGVLPPCRSLCNDCVRPGNWCSRLRSRLRSPLSKRFSEQRSATALDPSSPSPSKLAANCGHSSSVGVRASSSGASAGTPGLMWSSRTSGCAAHVSDRQVRSQSRKLPSHSACVMSFLVMLRPTPPEGAEMRQSAMQQPTSSSARANELPAIVSAPRIRPIHIPRIAISHNRMFAASTPSGTRYSEGALSKI